MKYDIQVLLEILERGHKPSTFSNLPHSIKHSDSNFNLSNILKRNISQPQLITYPIQSSNQIPPLPSLHLYSHEITSSPHQTLTSLRRDGSMDNFSESYRSESVAHSESSSNLSGIVPRRELSTLMIEWDFSEKKPRHYIAVELVSQLSDS
jgi:hypothetical protein